MKDMRDENNSYLTAQLLFLGHQAVPPNHRQAAIATGDADLMSLEGDNPATRNFLLFPGSELVHLLPTCRDRGGRMNEGFCRVGDQYVVNEERCCHPNLRIREKMLVLWLLHTGLTRQHAAKAVGVSRATVQRYVAAFRQGGLDGLRQWNLSRPVSEMAAYRELIRDSFEKQPATTIAEACERIFQLTGLVAGPARCASSSRIWA